MKMTEEKRKNKAVYTAALVADGGQGRKTSKKDFVTDGPTDGPTDRKVAYRVACPRLKIVLALITHSVLKLF